LHIQFYTYFNWLHIKLHSHAAFNKHNIFTCILILCVGTNLAYIFSTISYFYIFSILLITMNHFDILQLYNINFTILVHIAFQ